MPNTPAQVGEGMSVWTASPGVTTRHEEAARTILRSLGEEMYVSEEKYLDMATALSASGPAYVFLFLESLIDAGGVPGPIQGDGTDPSPADRPGKRGPGQELRQTPAELRNMVTSPGGTTAEALLSMEDDGLRSAIINGVIAAHEKAVALGEED